MPSSPDELQQDIDRARRARLHLALQNNVTAELADADAAEDALFSVMRAIVRTLDWPAGAVWAPESATQTLRSVAVWTDGSADLEDFARVSRTLELEPGHGLPGRAWVDAAPVCIEDMASDPACRRARLLDTFPLRGALAVPILADGIPCAVIELFSRGVVEPHRELLDTLEAVGRQVGHFMRRRSAEGALRESEARLRAFARSTPDALFIIDAEGEIRYANPAAHRMFGHARGELAKRSLRELLAAPDGEAHQDRLRHFVETGERLLPWSRHEVTGVRSDGSEIPVEISIGHYVRDGEHYFTGIARDITDRKRAEEELRFHASVADAVGEAVIATDLGGRILYWNRFAEELYGWTADEAIGRAILDVTPAREVEGLAAELMQRLQSGESWSGEMLLRRKDGSTFIGHVTDTPIHDADGELVGVVGVSFDLTETKRSEEVQRLLAEAGKVLASSFSYESTLSAVADLAVPTLGDWCFIQLAGTDTDRPPTVAFAGPDSRRDTAVELLRRHGADPETGAGFLGGVLTGKGARIIRVDEDSLESVDAGTAAVVRELRLSALVAVPLRARGHALGILALAVSENGRRLSDRERDAVEELGRSIAFAVDNARLYRQSQEANRAKADFLAIVSHELRTPLNAITGYADLLEAEIEGTLTDTQKTQVGRIKMGAWFLTQLIDEILTYARVEAEDERISIEETDLVNLAHEAAAVIEPAAHDKGLELRLDLPDEPATVRTDARKLRQILVNLLSNAVKYTEDGHIELCATRSGEHAVLRISDTGIGIREEHRDKVFEAFWQSESPNTRTIGGTGLGLTVVKKLVGLLSGELSLESELDVGSTFTVRLPDLDVPVVYD